MLKCLSVFGFLLAIAQNHVPADRSHEEQHPQTHAADAQPSAPSPLATEISKKDGTGTDNDAQGKTKAKQYLKDAFAAANLSNWVLAAIGIVGGILALCTLLAIKRQGNLMEKQLGEMSKQTTATEANATAAEANTRTLREMERSWVVETVKFPDKIPRRSEMLGGGVLSVVFVLENIGERPALIRKAQVVFHVRSDRLPPEPEYPPTAFSANSQINPNGRLLIPGKPWGFEAFLLQGSLDDDSVDQIESGQLQLCAYGRIDYETAGFNGVNQFCYLWQPLMGVRIEGEKPGLYKSGPANYNKHT